MAEGFALTEWSSRGLSLAGGLVGRADDPSAIAYNAAGITQLPGTQLMGGFAAIAPMGTIQAFQNGESQHTQTKPNIWPAPHGYVTHQLNDRVWLGLGVFSRFGLGNEYDSNWFGRYNVTDISLQTVSAVPTVAFKVSDVLSLSAGVEIMYGMFSMGSQIPTYTMDGFLPQQQPDNEMNLSASGWGFGAQFGAHLRMNDEWSLGLTYKSKVALKLLGDASFGRQTDNFLAEMNQVPHALDTNAHGTVILPDSVSLGLSYKPLDNLSFEVGTVWTRWSDFKSLENQAIAVQIGTTGADKAKDIPGAKVTNYNATSEAFMALTSRNAEAVVHDRPVLAYFMKTQPRMSQSLQLQPAIEDAQQYGFAVKKGNKELLDKLNKGLEAVRQAGEDKQIYSKWFAQ